MIVDPRPGEVRESWTGYQVAWKMARGYSGAFGHKLNAPYVFLPLCALFLLGLLDWRRPLADRQPRPARPARLRRLALLLQPGRDRRLGPARLPGRSLYLLGAHALDRLPRRRRGPAPGLAGRLAAGRGALPGRLPGRAQRRRLGRRSTSATRASSAPTGSPTASRSTATSPTTSRTGDTYGPVNYYAYVPFERVWPWSGSWDDLPAAHGAAVFFDLADLRPADPARPAASAPARRAAASARSSPSPGPPTPTPPTPSSRTPTTRSSRRSSSATLLAARPTRCARGAAAPSPTLTKFAPLAAGADCSPRVARWPAAPRPARPRSARDRPRRPAVGAFVLAFVAVGPGAGLARRSTPASHLLRPDHRLPGRPRLAVQHLGPGRRPRAAADAILVGAGVLAVAARLPPAPQDAWPRSPRSARRC